MTRKRYMSAKCQKCNVDAVCPECGQTASSSTPFSDWLRGLPKPLNSKHISLHDLDFIWHNYKENWFITIEEKRFGGSPSFAQRDTQGIVKQLLEVASGSTVTNARGEKVRVEYRGHYYVIFEKTLPCDSKWVKINDTYYAEVERAICYLLKNGVLTQST